MESSNRRFGILVGGGPAPGINGVISAATIEARKNGHEVVGFYEGFSHLMEGETKQIKMLDIHDVTRIHFQGGSILRTSRANPTKKPEQMRNVLNSLRHHRVGYMVTIGGDDTAFSACKLGEAAKGEIQVAHVPKTIDNDLPLPHGTPTFGFETARHYGAEIVRNLIADANTTPRWYLVVAMGRAAGHLALGIGKAAAAPLTLIPEEFRNGTIGFKEICDVIEGAIIKRLAQGRNYGVAILAEGLIEKMDPQELEKVFGGDIERDAHGHIRLDDLDMGRTIRDELRHRFLGRLNVTLVNKNLGYELRSADPIPFDREYTRDLGFGAVRFLLSGGTGAIITFVGGKLTPMFFDRVERNAEGRLHPRTVDVDHEAYLVAREYMIRLDAKDRAPEKLARLSKEAKITPEKFLEQFGHLMV